MESVANQTLRPLELILVDDGSGEKTVGRLRSLRDEFGIDWLRLIELKDNRGAAAARNIGWDAACGDYVAFLDADDAWLPQKLERQWMFMESHREFMLTGHLAIYANAAKLESLPESGPLECRPVSRLWVLLQNPMVTPSFMVRRTIPLRFDPLCRYMEDHRLLQQLVLSGQAVARLEERLAIVYKAPYGEGGLSADLWAMEKSELANYLQLKRRGRIGRLSLSFFLVYSLVKFCRRLGVVTFRRIFPRAA